MHLFDILVWVNLYLWYHFEFTHAAEDILYFVIFSIMLILSLYSHISWTDNFKSMWFCDTAYQIDFIKILLIYGGFFYFNDYRYPSDSPKLFPPPVLSMVRWFNIYMFFREILQTMNFLLLTFPSIDEALFLFSFGFCV